MMTLTSPKITLEFLFSTYYLYNGISFLRCEKLVWQKPEQPDHFCQPWFMAHTVAYSTKIQQGEF